MKIGIFGDIHFSNRSPERRKDDYFQTQIRKFEEALQIFEKFGCDIVVQPGDFFEAPTAANRVKSTIITILKKYNRTIHAIAGQHDIVGHSLGTYPNSPLAVLEASGVTKLVGKGLSVGKESDVPEAPEVMLYGASFGEDTPKPFEDTYNVLLIHKMIGNKKLYPGQELTDPIRFLEKYSNFDLICCGDYHYRFVETWNGRTIINAGALVRKTISEHDLEHTPAVVVYDTVTTKAEVVELNVSPVEEIFDLSRTNSKDIDFDKILLFIDKLRNSSLEVSGNWREGILSKLLLERKCNDRVKVIIDQCLEEIKR